MVETKWFTFVPRLFTASRRLPTHTMAPNGCGDLNYQRSQPGSHVQRHTDTASGRPGATLGHRGGAGEASSRAPACLQTGAAACWAEAIKNGCRRTARRPRGVQRAQVEAELATCAPTSNGTLSDSSVSEVEGAAKSFMRQCSRSAPMAGGSRSRWWSSTMHRQHLAPRDGRLLRRAGCTMHGRVQCRTSTTTRFLQRQRPPRCRNRPAPAWLWSAEP